MNTCSWIDISVVGLVVSGLKMAVRMGVGWITSDWADAGVTGSDEGALGEGWLW